MASSSRHTQWGLTVLLMALLLLSPAVLAAAGGAMRGGNVLQSADQTKKLAGYLVEQLKLANQEGFKLEDEADDVIGAPLVPLENDADIRRFLQVALTERLVLLLVCLLLLLPPHAITGYVVVTWLVAQLGVLARIWGGMVACPAISLQLQN